MSEKKTIRAGAVCLLVSLLAALFFTACVSKSVNAADKIELGQKYLTELNYTEAVASFTEAIKLDPDNIQAYMGRAEAYMALGEYDKALADYRFISGMTEDMPYTRALSYIGQAEVYEKMEQPARAVSDYGLAKALLKASDAGKAENVSEEDVSAKLVQVLYVHAALCETLKNYNTALEDYNDLLELGENTAAKRDEVLSQLGETAEDENGLTDTEKPAAESTAEKPMEEPAEEIAPEQEAASESESQSAKEETKKEEPASSSEQEKEEAASSTAVQEKQTYTAKETTPWSNESQSGTTTVVDKVSYQIGENTITLHHTYTDTWTNYAEPGIQHTQKINATNTYTLSQPLQGIERQGQWVVIWDVPAGTVVSLSGIETDAWDGETDGSWNQDGLSEWLKTSRVLTPDEVYEWGYGTDYGCTEGWGDTLTVEKGKLYELIDVNEGGYFPTDGGFVFRGV